MHTATDKGHDVHPLTSLFCRWFWHIPRNAQLFHPCNHVYVLRALSNGTRVPKVHLVEEICYQDANRKFLLESLNRKAPGNNLLLRDNQVSLLTRKQTP